MSSFNLVEFCFLINLCDLVESVLPIDLRSFVELWGRIISIFQHYLCLFFSVIIFFMSIGLMVITLAWFINFILTWLRYFLLIWFKEYTLTWFGNFTVTWLSYFPLPWLSCSCIHKLLKVLFWGWSFFRLLFLFSVYSLWWLGTFLSLHIWCIGSKYVLLDDSGSVMVC